MSFNAVRSLLVFVMLVVRCAWASDAVPTLALAPVAPEQLEGQERAGEALTAVLGAALSNDARWEMVERGELSALTAEWQIGKAGVVESTNAVNQGRLLRADWVLVCRPEMADVENPTASIEVIDALRAERLASRIVKLTQRPHARWFRSPPEVDVALIVEDSKAALVDARAIREKQVGRKVASLLFLAGDDGRLESEFASSMGDSAGGAGKWRLLNPLHPDVARGEGLLKAAGFISADQGAAAERIADVYIWGRLEPAGDASKRVLAFWIWRGSGLPVEKQAEGSWSDLARAMRSALLETETAATGSAATLADQLQLANRLVGEALAVAPATATDFKQSRKLLEMAAFFAPHDRVIQETRLAFTLASRRIQPGLEMDDRIRLRREYARLADAFWRGPDNTLDARLLEASFPGDAREMPGQRERALQHARLLVQAPVDELAPHKKLFSSWMTYCRKDPVNGMRLLEIIWPVTARLLPETLYTQPTKMNGARVGWVNQLQDDPFIDQTRFSEIVAGSAKGLPPLVVDAAGARYRIANSAAPHIGGGVITRPGPESTGRNLQSSGRQQIVKADGLFKLLADYERAQEMFTPPDAESEKRRAQADERREQQIARLELQNPDAARRMRESHARLRKQIEDGRLVEANRRLDTIREYLAQASKSGTVSVPGINDRQDDGATPLAIAVARGWPEVAEVLIKAGADPLRGIIRGQSVRDFAASDPVMSRVLAGRPVKDAREEAGLDAEAVVALLRKGDRVALAGVTISDVMLSYKDTHGWTVLHHAIERQIDEFALRMIAAGAPLEAASAGGQTPLTFAAFKARGAVVKALLEKKANPNGRATTKATTPLLAACVGGDGEIVRLLLAAGADVNVTVKDRVPLVVDAAGNSANVDAIEMLVKSGARLDVGGSNDDGPLEASLIKDRVKTLRYLLDNGAKWRRAREDADSSPLIIAAQNNAVACVQLLLERGERDDRARQFTSNPEIRAMLEDKMQATATGVKTLDDDVLWPAILADKHKWRERMDAHLARGGNVNFQSVGWTPLWLAIQTRNVECVRHALAKGADPKVHPRAPDLQGRTTLNGVNFMQSVLEPHAGPALAPIGEQEAYRVELIKLLVPVEPSPDYGRELGRVLADRQWLEAAAYVRAGANTEDARAYLSKNKKLTEAERARAMEVLNGR